MVGQVLRSLGAAGVVVSRQGRHGGFRLARPAGTIPLRAVIAAVGSGERLDTLTDPSDTSRPVSQSGSALPANRAEGAVDRFWRTLDSPIRGKLSAVTGADLLAESAPS